MTIELFQQDPYLQSCDAIVEAVDAERRCFSVNQSVFYPTGGGQPGDTGCAFYNNDDDINIIDTHRNRDTGVIQHFIDDVGQLPSPGDRLYLELDWDRRYRLMRMHSCLHMLCAIIPGRVTGGQVYDGRGRLDFDLKEVLDKQQLTHSLNVMIRQSSPRVILECSSDEIAANRKLASSLSVPVPNVEGAVRLVHFKGIDIQPCGGTHVANSEEIGQVRVTKIENKGRHNRRVSVVLED